MNNKLLFSGHQNSYTKSRPDYAEKFLDDLYTVYSFSENSIIADIGSGTGIFSKQLLERGSTVYGIEPNTDMRRKAEKELCGFDKFFSIAASAENTGLKSGSVDIITSAQAFHWFDTVKFKQECRRILKPMGLVVLAWNMRDEKDSATVKCRDVFSKYCPDFKDFSGGIGQNDKRIQEFFCLCIYEKKTYDNDLMFTKKKFIQRCLSSSYALHQGDDRYNEYLSALTRIFDDLSDGEHLCMKNKTIAYIGRFN